MRRIGEAASWATLVVCAVACLPEPRVIELDTGKIVKPDAGADATAADAPAAPTDASAAADAGSPPADAAQPEVVDLAMGCTADSDCAGLPVPACQEVHCLLDTGLCVLSAGADGTPCTLDTCTIDATCNGGTCSGTARNCDDGNACTHDGCTPSAGAGNGCSHVNLAEILGLCSDGDGCTTQDVCVDGACKGKPLACDDQDPCTVDSCNPKSGACQHLPTTGDAVIACEVDLKVYPGSGPGKCIGNVCKQADGKAPCDDDDPCTKDVVPAPGYGVAGCKHLPLAGALCSGANKCDQGVCAIVNGKLGCKIVLPYVDTPCQATVADGSCALKDKPVGTACANPVDLCHTAQCTTTVSGLQCKATKTLVVCNDGNACTSDFCTPTGGCQTTANDAGVCDDGNACTIGKDACKGGICTGTPADCSDGNPCTVDSCDPVGGCSHSASKDGSPCGAAKACQKGACVGS